MSAPRISVITPCLNARETIERTLRSVHTQGYPNLQHVVVDGGSTDGTLDLVRQYEDIVLISEPDDGLSDALNKGLRLADGDIIGWLNADDLYLPGALSAVAAAYERNPTTAWITGPCRIIGSHDEEIRPWVTRYKSLFLRRYSYFLLLMQNFISAPSTFLTTVGVQTVGSARVELRYSMDYDLWLRAGRSSRPEIVDLQLAAFRMVDGTLSMTGFERQFEEHARIARSHARGYEVIAAGMNAILSRVIVMIYRVMQRRRQVQGGEP